MGIILPKIRYVIPNNNAPIHERIKHIHIAVADFSLLLPVYLSSRMDTHEWTPSVSPCESNPLYGMRQRGARQPRSHTQSHVLAAQFPLRRRYEDRMRPRSVLDLRKFRPYRCDTTTTVRSREGMHLQLQGDFPRKQALEKSSRCEECETFYLRRFF